jgi:hypothetical protein
MERRNGGKNGVTLQFILLTVLPTPSKCFFFVLVKATENLTNSAAHTILSLKLE